MGKSHSSHTIFLPLLTQLMMRNFSLSYLPLLIFLTNRMSVTTGFHTPRQYILTSTTLSLTYLNYELKYKVQHSLHLLQQSMSTVRFCESLTPPQRDARMKYAQSITELNSYNPLPKNKYVIRGNKNVHIAVIPNTPPIQIDLSLLATF